MPAAGKIENVSLHKMLKTGYLQWRNGIDVDWMWQGSVSARL